MKGFPGGLGTGGDRETGMGWWGREQGLHSPAPQMLAALWPSGRGNDEGELQLWGCGAASDTFPLTKMAAKGLFASRDDFLVGFFSTWKKQTQAPQPTLCYGTEPWLASHKGGIKQGIKMLPFISAQ